MLPESSETLDDAWGNVIPWGGLICASGFLLVRLINQKDQRRTFMCELAI